MSDSYRSTPAFARDSLDTSEREAEDPRMLRLPVREMRDEPEPTRDGEQSKARQYADILNHRYASSVEKSIAAELLRLERDAQRYRWLRDVGDATWRPFGIREGYSAVQADAAIDAARAAGQKGGT